MCQCVFYAWIFLDQRTQSISHSKVDIHGGGLAGTEACGSVVALTDAVTVLTVGVNVGPAVTTDGIATVAATGATDDTATPFTCVTDDDVTSAVVVCAEGTGAGLVTTVLAAVDAAGG